MDPGSLNIESISGLGILTVIGMDRCRREFYREHIFEFSESLQEVTNCVRFIFLFYKVSTVSCVQIVLENRDLHAIKTNSLFKKPSLSNVSLVAIITGLCREVRPSS
jgi:hypothetical protein